MAGSLLAQMGIAGLLGAPVVGGVQMVGAPGSPVASMARGCNTRGKVSVNSGEHIYHVSGQMFYAETVIRPEYGERWFCSEAEARQAGVETGTAVRSDRRCARLTITSGLQQGLVAVPDALTSQAVETRN